MSKAGVGCGCDVREFYLRVRVIAGGYAAVEAVRFREDCDGFPQFESGDGCQAEAVFSAAHALAGVDGLRGWGADEYAGGRGIGWTDFER